MREVVKLISMVDWCTDEVTGAHRLLFVPHTQPWISLEEVLKFARDSLVCVKLPPRKFNELDIAISRTLARDKFVLLEFDDESDAERLWRLLCHPDE